MKNLTTRIISIGILVQFLGFLLVSVIGKISTPCCQNQSHEISAWYALISQPLYFFSILIPGFLVGRFEHIHFVKAGLIVGAVSSLLWGLLENFLMLQLFPERAMGEVGTFSSLLYMMSSVEVLFSISITAFCNSLAACAAACAGYVFNQFKSP